MKINSKLFLSFSIMAVLLTIAGYVSNSQVTKVAGSFDVVKNEATPSIIALGSIKSDFNALHAAVLAYNLHVPEAASNPEVKQMALDHLGEVDMQKQNLLASLDNYKSIEGENFDSSIGERADHLIAHIDEMTMMGTDIMNGHEDAGMAGEMDHADHMAAAGGTGETAESPIMQLHLMILDLNEQAMTFNEELDAKIQEKYASLTSTQEAVLGDIEGSINMNAMLTIAAVSIVFVIGGLAAYSITGRVKQLKSEAKEVSSGNLEAIITTPGSDEIADLANNFEHMRKSMVGMQHEIRQRNQELQKVNSDLLQANENLKRLDHLKDEFIGVASHELKNPIHPILGYAIMGKEGKIPSEMAFDIIAKQASKLRQLANDILDVSRIESNTISYKMEKANIHEILLNTLVAASSNIDFRQVSLNVQLDERNKDLLITADKTRIAQVFTNIVGNAVKFTKKGEITVETHLNKEAKKLEIKVSDSGGGIPDEVLPRLFGKFVTKSVGDNNKHGTGLGLFISKAIVTAHGGTIRAHNNEKGGATFQIDLPAEGEGSEMLVQAQSKN